MRRAETEELSNPAHLPAFLLWYSLGGLQRGIGITELLTLDYPLMHDWLLLLRRLRLARERKEAHDHAQG